MWVCDLGDVDAAARLALEAWDALGHLDVLVNNAAIPKVRAIDGLTMGDVEHAMRVNYFSPVAMTLAGCRECANEAAAWSQRGQPWGAARHRP